MHIKTSLLSAHTAAVFTQGENFRELNQGLNKAGVKAGRIFKDELLGIDLLLVTDPEDNIFEIINSDGSAKAEESVEIEE